MGLLGEGGGMDEILRRLGINIGGQGGGMGGAPGTAGAAPVGGPGTMPAGPAGAMPLGAPQLDTSLSADPYAGQRPEHGGLRGLIDKGVNALGGSDRLKEIGAILMAGDGNTSMLNYLARQKENAQQDARELRSEDRADQRFDRQRAAQDRELKIFGDSETGFKGINGLGEITDLLSGLGPKKTQAELNYEAMMKLPPEQRGQFRSMLPGYGLTDDGVNAYVTRTNRSRAPKTGGGAGVTPTARARYIAEAEAAIAQGADPAKVRARLANMGIH